MRHLQKHFGFSRTELRGMTVLLLLLILVWIFPVLLRWVVPPVPPDMTVYRDEIQMFLAAAGQQKMPSSFEARASPARREAAPAASVYFPFDPNVLQADGWQKLGLSERQIRNIINYRQSGGVFRKKADLKKMYTLTESDYSRLEPYIQITAPVPAVPERKAGLVSDAAASSQPVRKIPMTIVMELNAADSLSLQQLPGIGPVYASRIVRYRERLGGFFSTAQLLDVYGMDTLRYERLLPQLTVDTMLVNKIDINEATYEEFRNHPFISPKQAGAIVRYRKQHGRFAAVSDLARIVVLDEHSLYKMKPYLVVHHVN